MKGSFARKLLSMVLCMTLVMGIFMVPTASASTYSQVTAQFDGTIMNNNWLFASKSQIRISNSGCGGSALKVTISCTGCTVSNGSSYVKTFTKEIRSGGVYTFNIKVPARSYGTVRVTMTNVAGTKLLEYEMKCTNVNTMVKTR